MMRLDDEYLDKKFDFLKRYLKASIYTQTYQSIDFLYTYGFYVHVKYKEDIWHYSIDHTKTLADKEIEWMRLIPKIGPSPMMDITVDDFNYLKEELS